MSIPVSSSLQVSCRTEDVGASAVRPTRRIPPNMLSTFSAGLECLRRASFLSSTSCDYPTADHNSHVAYSPARNDSRRMQVGSAHRPNVRVVRMPACTCDSHADTFWHAKLNAP